METQPSSAGGLSRRQRLGRAVTVHEWRIVAGMSGVVIGLHAAQQDEADTRLTTESWHVYPIGVFGLGFGTASEVALLFLAAGAAGAVCRSTRSCAWRSCLPPPDKARRRRGRSNAIARRGRPLGSFQIRAGSATAPAAGL